MLIFFAMSVDYFQEKKNCYGFYFETYGANVKCEKIRLLIKPIFWQFKTDSMLNGD